ncbi:restriction endonuclease subunit S [Avibacterium paragallinarum]|uniref:Restriction endonuclease subunit S n=2 Tax=Avibacterium paragallinarum TaxID=728 RepID=A0ABU7QHY4_AVIPA
MQQVEWAEFELQELFEVKTSKKRFDANKVKIEDVGYPYVVRTAANNGIKGYLNEDSIYLNEGNTISFGQDTATMFYQEKPYFTGDKIKVLKPKIALFNKKNAQFFIPIMTRAFSSFSWGSSSFSEKIIQSQKLSLPIKHNPNLDKIAQIDFDFMEYFIAELEAYRIAELEAYRIAELEAYLIATGLSNYTLTKKEQKILDEFNENVVGGGVSD